MVLIAPVPDRYILLYTFVPTIKLGHYLQIGKKTKQTTYFIIYNTK